MLSDCRTGLIINNFYLNDVHLIINVNHVGVHSHFPDETGNNVQHVMNEMKQNIESHRRIPRMSCICTSCIGCNCRGRILWKPK